jgi:hypothetical protein
MPKVQTPEDYSCPITHQLMVDPVLASDGHTYEREAINKWLEKNNTSPMNNTVLQHKYLAPNLFAKTIIEQFLNANNVCTVEKFWEVIKERNVEELKKINFLERHLESKNDGLTALHYIAGYVRNIGEPIVKILLQEGAYVDILDDDGGTPLIWAVFNRNMVIIKLLVEAGTKIDHADNWGWTSLHYAACHNATEILELLLDHKANINETNSEGRTPLHIAAIHGNEESVKLLLERGANYHLTSKDNQTPVQLAQAKYPKLAKMIPKYRQGLKFKEVINKQKTQLEQLQAQLNNQQAEIEALKQQLSTVHRMEQIQEQDETTHSNKRSKWSIQV